MKKMMLFFFLHYFLWVSAQTDDSLSIKQVDSLIKVSRELTGKKDFQKALELNASAEKLALEKFGKESARYGLCCLNRGRVNHLKKDYQEAETWYLESKAIMEKVLGKEHPNYAQSLNNLANLYSDMGNYEKAEPLYLESKAIREKVLGKEHPNYAQSLNGLAILYKNMGNYENAELLYLESKAITEKMLGKEHPNYLVSLSNLSNLYYQMGNYEKAEPLYLESKAISAKMPGKEHPNYAANLNDLAVMYWQMGNYEKAEPLYLESKAIREKMLGKEHPYYAVSLQNLAILYKDMGNYEKAEQLYIDSKAIIEKMLGKEHPDYALSLNNLANLYGDMDNNEKAEALYLESKTIMEKMLGKEHPNYALNLNNLAILYKNMGNYEKAELLYNESKAIMEKVLGQEHPKYAASLQNLAKLYKDMGNYKKAEPLYLESTAILEKVIGKEHPKYAASLNNLTDLYERQNRFSESALLLAETYALDQARLSSAITFLSERELASYTATFQAQGDNLGAYILARLTPGAIGEEDKQLGILPALQYSNALFYKGFLLTAAAQLNALAETSPESKEISLRLKSYQRRLSAEYAKPIEERKNVAELEAEVNTSEKELVRSRLGYAEAKRLVKWEEVMSTLKKDEAAIEYISFEVNYPSVSDSTIYVALLLKPGAIQPLFIPLFEEKQLTQLLSNNKESNLITSLYASRGATPIDNESLRGLYDLFWKPLAHLLSDTKIVYYSPSGLLHRFNFDAIPIDEKTNLSDKYKLVRLGSTRSLVVPDLTKIDSSNKAILFGGINYNMDTALNNSDTIIHDVLASKGEELSFSYADRGIKERGIDWGFLPGTEKEIHGVSKLFQKAKFNSTTFTGNYATEESFKSIGKDKISPRILHIATHGFFFPDRTISDGGKMAHDSATSDPNKMSGAKAASNKPKLEFERKEPVFKISDHPMIRSGLILAGGNYAWKEGKPYKEGMEDGILTAYEISQMNLSNTELVVLSACETGLGDIQGNEGVYGLQRAFKIAGAKYLIMSLWQVPDKQTSLLMTTFYKKWLEDKMSIPDAFHAAQKQLRDGGLEPYYWAGFVLVE